MGTRSRYSPEARERAIRTVLEHQGEHESKCAAEILRSRVRQAERDQGNRPGLTTGERERQKEQEGEIRWLRRVNGILREV